jgi:hypothetical protein
LLAVLKSFRVIFSVFNLLSLWGGKELGPLQVVSLGLETITAFCASYFCMLKKIFGFKFKAVGISLKQSAVTPLRLTRGLPPGWQDIVLPKLLLFCSAFVQARQASIRFWKSPFT